MAGASIDDVFVIVLFTAVLGTYDGQAVTFVTFLTIPISILLSIGVGSILGFFLPQFLKKLSTDYILQTILLLSVGFLLVSGEALLEQIILFSGLLAIMFLGMQLLKKDPKLAKQMEKSFNQMWKIAEILLFVLVGAAVNITYIKIAGIKTVLLILFALAFRSLGVFIALIKSGLTLKEKLFCVIAYLPKATVQASIGSIPLMNGLEIGNLVLSLAMMSILITAPIGAMGIDLTTAKLLTRDNPLDME